ncbi:MAG: 3'(2'),5'-bisphosphate nucleotidase CysQ [Vicinamibacterales bacterium]
MVAAGPSTPSALLPAIVALAEEAGRVIEAGRAAGPIAAEAKADGSPVTKPDRESHAVIAAGLASLTPGVPVVSEEGRIAPQAERAGWTRFWLVDPLDGTKEFVAGRPEYTVNIALLEDGVPVLGVVHVPRDGTTYAAAAGAGSWRYRPGQPAARLFASPPPAGAGLRVAESRSHGSPELDDLLAAYTVRERITIGSSLKFCLVAEGTADCYIRLGPTMEWDVAAGDAVFRWAVPDGAPPHASPLVYNKPDLRNGAFTIGFLPPPPSVVWLTGLSGSGKSTIAAPLVEALRARGARVEWLDGDAIREVFPSTGFTRPDRDAHIRRVGYLASRLEAHGVTVVATLVSPYRDSRQFVRGLCTRFVEVHVATPFSECERRDPKGLYRKARAGQIANFTGLDDPYEAPEAPEVTIDTTALSPEAAAARILAHLERQPAAASRP